MSLYARLNNDQVAELLTVPAGFALADVVHPDFAADMQPVPQGLAVQVGWRWDGTAFTAPTATPDVPRYVPVHLIRTRLQAVGLWDAFCEAFDTLPASKRLFLLTLERGVAPDDADAVALFEAIGANPAAMLAP